MKKVKKILLLVLALTMLFTTTVYASETELPSAVTADEETYFGQPASFYKLQIPSILESTFYCAESMEELQYKHENSVGYIADAYSGYMAVFESLGAFVESGSTTLEYHEEEEELNVVCEATFENAKLVSTVVCKVYGEEIGIKSISFAQRDLTEASFGEMMGKAAINTLIGMGTVFIVLIFISFIIYLLKFVPKLFEKKEKTAKDIVELESPIPAAPALSAEAAEETDDTELIAVIAAAIAASEGTTTDGFVVRSIRKRR